MHTQLRRIIAWGAIATVSIGCEQDTSPIDSLEATVEEEQVAVDTYCDNGGCDNLPTATVTLSLDASDLLPDNDALEFLQYRVDYTSLSVDDIPYLAGPVDIVLERQASTTATLPIAGTAQRESVYEAVGGKQIPATARVTLAGYDELDARVDYSFTVNIAFGDFTVDAQAEGVTP